MVTTKHCCHGTCRRDSRYADRDYMKGITFIPFTKPKANYQKAFTWTSACGRPGFNSEKITNDTYICSLHFIGGNAWTDKSAPRSDSSTSNNCIKGHTHFESRL